MIGSCSFEYWDVEVEWDKNIVYYIRFKPRFSGRTGPVPRQVSMFLAGKTITIPDITSQVFLQDGMYSNIYNRVLEIPYGDTQSYGSIAKDLGTGSRIVGLAMKRNPTPILIPCHRVVAKNGLGGFSPDIRIKEALLALEKRVQSEHK